MASVVYDFTQQANYALEIIDKEKLMERAILKAHILWQKFARESAARPRKLKFHDNKWIIPLKTRYPASSRGVPIGTYVPKGDASEKIKMTAKMFKTVATADVRWENLAVGDSKAYVIGIVQEIQDDILVDMRDTFGIQGYGGEGSALGSIAKVHSSDSATPTILTLDRHDGSEHGSSQPGSGYCRIGQSVVIDAAGSIATSTQIAKIASVDDHETITLDSQVASITDGDIIVPGEIASDGSTKVNQYLNVPTGLLQHVNTTIPSTYQGQTRSSYPVMQGTILAASGASRDLTAPLIRQAYASPMAATMGEQNFDIIITTLLIQQDYCELFDSQIRFTPGQTLGLADVNNIKFPGNIVPDIDPRCQPGRIYFLNSKSFTIAHADEIFGFQKGETGNILRLAGRGDDTDTLNARCRAYWQLICDRPKENVVIVDLFDSPTSLPTLL